jgi:hypothetical protein
MSKLLVIAALVWLIGGIVGVLAGIATDSVIHTVEGVGAIAIAIASKQFFIDSPPGITFVIEVSEMNDADEVTGRELRREVCWRTLPRTGEYIALGGNEHEVRKVGHELFKGPTRVHIDVWSHDFNGLSIDRDWLRSNF